MRSGLIAFSVLSLPLCPAPLVAQTASPLPETVVTASRLDDVSVVGASVTVLNKDDLERSPAQTLQDLLAQQPGIQIVNASPDGLGARQRVDMRGFGATAGSNTLVLLNGRRLTDIDLQAVDFAAIPKATLERIEIIRGTAGGVLYGDGAIGGVINIVTDDGAGQPIGGRAEVAVGSYGYLEGLGQISGSDGPVSGRMTVQGITSDGYRTNNYGREMIANGALRYNGDGQDYYLNVSVDRQDLGLPGPRNQTQLVTDRRGTDTPSDYADTTGLAATLGGVWSLSPSLELIVDGGVRHKNAKSAFFSAWGSAFNTYNDTDLTTWSVTPRLKWTAPLFGLTQQTRAGLDVYYTDYGSDRGLERGLPAYRTYDISQTTIAPYIQQTLNLTHATDLSYGLRLQYDDLSAGDSVNTAAPGGTSEIPGVPLRSRRWHHALHLGLEHRFNETVQVFGRVGHNFRIPNVDERVGSAPWGVPVDYRLRTQMSNDAEVGTQLKFGSATINASGWLMNLRNEILYNPITFTNSNLDPTRRYGIETSVGWTVTETIRLRGGAGWTKATFRQGPWKGKDVPLVSPWTVSAGLSWDIWQKYVTLDADVRWADARRMDNDQANIQPQRIPAAAFADLRLGGAVENLRWSATVHNLFDRKTYDYAIASTTTPGNYNAYPLPGRTFMARLGVVF